MTPPAGDHGLAREPCTLCGALVNVLLHGLCVRCHVPERPAARLPKRR